MTVLNFVCVTVYLSAYTQADWAASGVTHTTHHYATTSHYHDWRCTWTNIQVFSHFGSTSAEKPGNPIAHSQSLNNAFTSPDQSPVQDAVWHFKWCACLWIQDWNQTWCMALCNDNDLAISSRAKKCPDSPRGGSPGSVNSRPTSAKSDSAVYLPLAKVLSVQALRWGPCSLTLHVQPNFTAISRSIK